MTEVSVPPLVVQVQGQGILVELLEVLLPLDVGQHLRQHMHRLPHSSVPSGEAGRD